MARRGVFLLSIGILVLASWLYGAVDARAQGVPGLIRDTEIENTIAAYAAPLLSAAGLNREAFNAHIVRSNDLNAFVARGQRVFITTGLLRRSNDAGEVIGVIAHELGHIAGGHLARLHGALDDASTAAMIAQLLGIAVGVMSGQPGAGAAIGTGGVHVAERSLLQFSRTQESAADQAGVLYLDRAGISARGLLSFMQVLSNQEFLHQNRQDPYMRTHPLSRERLAFLENHVANSPHSDTPLPEKFIEMHKRMVAKLDGFLDPPATTFRKYKEDDDSIVSRYARAVAWYRYPDMNRALPLIDGLIADEPDNPYFHELKGQMLLEHGRLKESVAPYETAVRLMPEAPQIRTGLAHAYIELQRDDLLDRAIGHLEAALQQDNSYASAWRLLGMGYGRQQQMGLSSWALAEYNILIGRRTDARGLAERAMKLLKEGEAAWLRSQDIVQETRRDRDR